MENSKIEWCDHNRRIQTMLPAPHWPALATVRRRAAKVGRALGRGQAAMDAAEAKLRETLAGLDDDALRLYAGVVMLSPNFCAATGQGGFWAVASDRCNAVAAGLLAARTVA